MNACFKRGFERDERLLHHFEVIIARTARRGNIAPRHASLKLPRWHHTALQQSTPGFSGERSVKQLASVDEDRGLGIIATV
jgi:hypothetical protein